MKKLIPTFIILIFAVNSLYAQEPPTISDNVIIAADPSERSEVTDIVTLPIFPGCENKDENQNIQCFTNIIREKITGRLYKQLDLLENIGLERMTTVVKIIVNTEGQLTGIETESGNSDLFNQLAEREMKQIAVEIPTAIPAKNKDGTAVNYQFRLPLTFIFAE